MARSIKKMDTLILLYGLVVFWHCVSFVFAFAIRRLDNTPKTLHLFL
jgi:hypothetical protein